MNHTLKNIIHDLEHGMFGGGVKLSLNYKDNVKLYYSSELKKIPQKLLDKKVVRRTLIGDIYYVTIR